ncbi:MAG: hypothetical protein ACFB9M_13625 [Myxococcota bacterium]
MKYLIVAYGPDGGKAETPDSPEEVEKLQTALRLFEQRLRDELAVVVALQLADEDRVGQWSRRPGGDMVSSEGMQSRLRYIFVFEAPSEEVARSWAERTPVQDGGWVELRRATVGPFEVR